MRYLCPWYHVYGRPQTVNIWCWLIRNAKGTSAPWMGACLAPCYVEDSTVHSSSQQDMVVIFKASHCTRLLVVLLLRQVRDATVRPVRAQPETVASTGLDCATITSVTEIQQATNSTAVAETACIQLSGDGGNGCACHRLLIIISRCRDVA